MSLKPMLWALDAADVDQGQFCVLISLAERADENGRNAWPSVSWLAKRARCSPRTVQRRLDELLAAGIIRRGDQELLSHLRGDRRPVVYDLVMDPEEPPARGDNLTPRSPDGPSAVTPRDVYGAPAVSPREAPRGDSHDTHGVTPVADKASFEPESTAAATREGTSTPEALAAEQQPAAVDPDDLDTTIDALRDAMDAGGHAGLSWRGLSADEYGELHQLVVVHGVERLVQLASDARRARKDRPAQHIKAPLATWREARPPRRLQAVPGTNRDCAEHPGQPAARCNFCEAPAPAPPPSDWRSRGTR